MIKVQVNLSVDTAGRYKQFTEEIFNNCLPCTSKEKWEYAQIGFMMLSALCCGEIEPDLFIELCKNTFIPSFQALTQLLSSISQDPTTVDTFL